MAIVGIQLDRQNPEYTIDDFTFWMPQFSQFMSQAEGQRYFSNIYDVVNQKIFYSIFGSDWKLAMSYGIAHYLTLIAMQNQAPSGQTLETIAGGGTTKGVISSMTVGEFNKTYELGMTMVGSEEAMFWNQTSYGAALMALLKTKAVPSIFVVTSNPVPGAN